MSDASSDALDELFTVAPRAFVARRDELAKELRRAGQRDEAKEVRSLRRPSASVWALNQLARRRPDDVAELLAAGADLPAAQDALLAGDQDRFRSALARHRDLVSRLAAEGARLVRDEGVSPTDHRLEIAAELQAASTTPEAAEPFRRGRLADSPETLGEPVTGLPAGGSPVEPAGRATGVRRAGGGADGARAEGTSPTGVEADEAEGARRAEREEARARADARVAEAAAAVDRARRARGDAAELVDELAEQLDRARRRLEEADAELTARRDELADAEAALPPPD